MAKYRRRFVRERADDRCEYCHLPQSGSTLPHTVDHIRARKHRGPTIMENTCWACAQCNGAKGSNVAGYDPITGALVRLFNPRVDSWADHFDGPFLQGLSAEGRATIEVLRINDPDRVEHRRLLLAADQWPV